MTETASSPQAQAKTVQLVRAPRQPDFRAIFEEGFDHVVHTLRRLGVREADLEDVAHDVFIIAHRQLANYDPARPLKAWLFGIAYRVASDYRKLTRHRRELVGAGARELADPAPDPEGQLALAERQRLVIEALEALDLTKRAVLVMHDIDGYAMPVIATTLSIPLNTAYSRLRLGREEFRAAVQRLIRLRGEP
jgi:RNA polymerase sigma-70 factor (ECF subfamily)